MKHLIFLLVLICTAASAQGEKVHPVSIINLIATPERFDGKVVSVNGELSVKMYGLVPPIWLSLSTKIPDLNSMILLNVPGEYLDHLLKEQGRFYSVIGVFHDCSAPIVDGTPCHLSLTPNRVGPDQVLDMRTYD